MKILKYITIAFLVLVLTSCGEDPFSTTLTIDPPEHQDRLVIQAFGSTRTNTLRVAVFQSVGLLDENFGNNTYITDADVKLVFDNQELSLEEIPVNEFEGFIYALENIEFETEKTYTLVVNAPGFPEARAESTLPKPVETQSITFDPTPTDIGDGDEYNTIEIAFSDPMETENYYEVGLILDRAAFGEQGFEMIYFDDLDPIIEYGVDNILFTDASFNGELRDLDLWIDTFWLNENPDIADFLYVNWRQVTEEHYRYSKSVEQQEEADGNPFASPIQIFNNFENGIGIFSIYNEEFIPID